LFLGREAQVLGEGFVGGRGAEKQVETGWNEGRMTAMRERQHNKSLPFSARQALTSVYLYIS